MVAGEAERIGGRKANEIRNALIRTKIERASKSGIQKIFVAQPRCTAMLGEAFIVKKLKRATVDPSRRGHLAKARSVSR